MNIFDLKIDEDFQKLLPPLAEEEYLGLEKDILLHGILSPIIVWDGYIVDGHNRYAICKAHGLKDVPTKEIMFYTKSDAMQWIIDHQLGKRNLTKSQLVKSYASIEQQLAKEARERQIQAGKEFGKGTEKVSQNFDEANNKRTDEAIADKIGVSRQTYRDMKLIVNEGTPEQIQRMNEGGKGNGVNTIAKEVKKEKEAKEETKICYICKNEYPISKFKKGTNRCLYCNRARNKRYDSEKRTGYSETLVKAMKDVKDPDKDRSITFETFYAELEIMADSFIDGWKSALEQNASLITDDNKDRINNLLKSIPTLGMCE